ATSGTLAIMVGGPTTTIQIVQPILDQLGKVTEVGPVGSGHALKALNNLLSATHLLATCEAMLVGEKFGLDKEVMLRVFNESSGRSASTENKWPNFILSEKFNSGFGLRLMLKDMNIATNLADEMGIPDRLATTATRLWGEAAQSLPATSDHTEIHRWVQDSEQVSG
ncbi:MAG TPA: NAD-binding protein, partial [Candidatus Nanopelagicaceae bacterium]